MDEEKQTKYLKKNDEVASQFDYSHSQVNQVDGHPTNAAVASQPADGKILHPKYWLTVIAVVIVYAVIFSFLPSFVAYVVYILVIGLMYRTIVLLKKKQKDMLTAGDKYLMVAYMAIDPLVGQGLYYYLLKKSKPESAKIALSVGWKVFGLFLVGMCIYIFFAVTQSWQYRHGVAFQASVDKITTDINAITADSKAYDSLGLIANCTKLIDDTAATKKIPTFPVQTTQSSLSGALGLLGDAANDCVRAVRTEDPTLLKSSETNIQTGYDELKRAVALMNQN